MSENPKRHLYEAESAICKMLAQGNFYGDDERKLRAALDVIRREVAS